MFYFAYPLTILFYDVSSINQIHQKHVDNLSSVHAGTATALTDTAEGVWLDKVGLSAV